ncbi:hypothetical protein F5Y14DRAFT_430276 [Nemania sp. NC0429]|nr:hypothetical protein F5Y14DRAFT_430276 [Nemania sp. NC0429]
MFTSTILKAGLALLASTRLVAAQSQNLTLTFYPDEDNTCSGDDSKAISFSTGSTTPVQSCFNLNEIFAKNSTGGVRNSSSSSTHARDVRWTITNSQAWDPKGNYSHVGYEQPDSTGKDDHDNAPWASRRVNIYNGDDCFQAAGPDDEKELLPWFSWTCDSSSDDRCRTVPYNIKSFVIIPLDDDDMDGQCLDFALRGASARGLPHMFGVLVTAMVVGLFLL